MLTRDQYFKGQQDSEKFICFTRHHWMYLLKEFIQLIFIIIAGVLLLIYAHEIQEAIRGEITLKLLFLTVFLGYTFWIHRTFLKFLNYFVNIGIITNLRFIDHQKSLFFKDTIDSIDMAQIQNIEQISEGVLPNMFGYGELRVYLSASASVKNYIFIPHVKFHFRCINRQKEARQQEMRMQSRIPEGPEEAPGLLPHFETNTTATIVEFPQV